MPAATAPALSDNRPGQKQALSDKTYVIYAKRAGNCRFRASFSCTAVPLRA